MARLIDADELIEIAHRIRLDSRERIERMIESAPTVDPVKHGYWIGVSQTKFEKLFFHSRVFKCSICGNYLDFDGINAGRGSANFCPNCGAKMDEVTNETY